MLNKYLNNIEQLFEKMLILYIEMLNKYLNVFEQGFEKYWSCI